MNHIVGIMVSVLTSSEVDCGFKPQSSQTKDYEICIYCFSTRNIVLKSKGKDWLDQKIQSCNMFEWSDMSTGEGGGFLFQ